MTGSVRQPSCIRCTLSGAMPSSRSKHGHKSKRDKTRGRNRLERKRPRRSQSLRKPNTDLADPVTTRGAQVHARIDGVSPAMRRELVERCKRFGNRLDMVDLRRFKNEAMDPKNETNLAEDSKTLDRILCWIINMRHRTERDERLEENGRGRRSGRNRTEVLQTA